MTAWRRRTDAVGVARARTWPLPLRAVVKLAVGLHRFLVHPFLDAHGYGSGPAWIAIGLGAAMIYRLVRLVPQGFQAIPVGWPEAWIVLSAFLGVALYEAAITLARTDPGRLLDTVTAPMGRGEVAHGILGEYVADETLPRQMPPDPE